MITVTGEFFAPTITNVSNVNAGASAGVMQYNSYDDDIISWGGFIYIVPSASASQFVFRTSIPVGVDFTNGNQLRGGGMCIDTVTNLVGNALASANPLVDLMTVQLNFSAATTNAINVQLSVLYEAIYSGA